MDELDKLKSHWQKNEETFPKVSEGDIYAMLHKRSSSIVKWILIISILEFAFWGLLSLTNSVFGIADYGTLPRFIYILEDINYFIVITFIVLFYINYRKISAEKPIKGLMNNIIRVRRIVTAYVIYNIGMITVGMLCGVMLFNKQNADDSLDANIILAVTVVTLLILIGFIGLMYYLLYGRLLKKLNKNYRELKKMTGL